MQTGSGRQQAARRDGLTQQLPCPPLGPSPSPSPAPRRCAKPRPDRRGSRSTALPLGPVPGCGPGPVRAVRRGRAAGQHQGCRLMWSAGCQGSWGAARRQGAEGRGAAGREARVSHCLQRRCSGGEGELTLGPSQVQRPTQPAHVVGVSWGCGPQWQQAGGRGGGWQAARLVMGGEKISGCTCLSGDAWSWGVLPLPTGLRPGGPGGGGRRAEGLWEVVFVLRRRWAGRVTWAPRAPWAPRWADTSGFCGETGEGTGVRGGPPVQFPERISVHRGPSWGGKGEDPGAFAEKVGRGGPGGAGASEDPVSQQDPGACPLLVLEAVASGARPPPGGQPGAGRALHPAARPQSRGGLFPCPPIGPGFAPKPLPDTPYRCGPLPVMQGVPGHPRPHVPTAPGHWAQATSVVACGGRHVVWEEAGLGTRAQGLTPPRDTRSRVLHLTTYGIVGNLASGKSALVHRYLTGTYVQEESPEGGRFKKEIVVDGQSYLLLIRDEGGPPEAQFAMWVDAVIFVFSLEDEISFQTVYHYYSRMASYRNTSEVPLVLVGTQDAISSSNPRVIDDARARRLSGDLKRCTYYETCATYGLNVERVFQDGECRLGAGRARAGGPERAPGRECPRPWAWARAPCRALALAARCSGRAESACARGEGQPWTPLPAGPGSWSQMTPTWLRSPCWARRSLN
ncbi:Arf-GAP with GTPase, ANK repeat and PH domain-containing protein 1 [Galemys pyrenaicus]|uniref:Arf-GAP with GTPase, ANK repeat and PH domain-containing protein 1 n=1 Tax=Galemys pyrenaicus TaxID=202257 RepID=A0A8J6DRF1_GALPY|nr:Arf-GAP with GTPase, ANK repeat and PH domain-containing protein 1 [Galemys pyrenaicus]